MKGLRRKFRRGLAGFLAFVLTMTSFNMVSWADVASAFETEKATFVMSGEEIRESAQAAIDSGNEFNFEDLGADASDRSLAKEYQRLFEAGTVYEFSPSYDMDEEEYADGAELRMFIRVDDAYEGYQITGDEDIVFLYINDSSARITFRSKIDGYTTQKVTVKGNSSLLDDNEAAVPGGEPQLPTGEEETNSDRAIETPDANGETNLEEETEASEPVKESESEKAIETPDTNEESESVEAIETLAADTETGETNENPDANAESNEDHSIQSPDPNTNTEENLNTETETDKLNEVQTPDENVSEDNQEPADHADAEPASEGGSNIDTTADENTAAPSSDSSSDVEVLSDDAGQLSVSRHTSYVLTTAISDIEENDNNDKALDEDKNNKAAEVPADNQEKAEEFQNEETDPVEATDVETNEETTIAAPVETESSNGAVSDEEEQTSVSSEEMIQVDNSIDNPVEKTEDNSENLSGEKESTVTVETSAEAEEQEEEKAVTGSTSGKTYGQIVLDESYYAKAYVTTLNKLHVDVSSEGYAVTYTVTPVGTATVKGAKNVAEGNDLSFTVKPQVGYVIDRVTANGEELEAVDDSEATDSNASLSAKRYTVPSVTEEQEIMISMSETGEHPEFSFSKTLGNVVVSLHAEDGILPAGTLAKVTEVTEKVQEAVKEKTAEETGEDTSENTVLAYDIKLFVENDEGELEALDNSWSENGYVDVTFSGRAIEEKSAEAETVEIKHVDTGEVDVTADDISKITSDEVRSLEAVSDIIEVPGAANVNELVFEAEHFSIYTIMFNSASSGVKIITVDTNGIVIGKTEDTYSLGSSSKTVTSISQSIKNGIPAGYEFKKATVGKKYYEGQKADKQDYIDKESIYSINRAGSIGNRKLQYQTSGNSQKVDIEKTQDIYFWYEPESATITFDINGGSGNAPEKISAKAGDVIDLPAGEGLSKKNNIFLGWARSKDSNTVTVVGSVSEKVQVFSAGGKFEVSKSETLYAVWAQNAGTVSNQSLTIAIRKDGVAPAEPSIQDGDKYYYLVNGLVVSNLLNYFNYAHTVANIDAVKENLKDAFYNLANSYNTNNKYWNTQTEYVDWYVIKYQGNDSRWHVDGVVRERSKVNLDYDPNCTDYSGLVPDGKQYTPGSMVTVEGKRTLERPGYRFICWNTDPNGMGISYEEGDRFQLNENTRLYAQWAERDKVPVYYRVINNLGGSVNRSEEWLNPETGVAQGATAAADNGYLFAGWYMDSAGSQLLTEDLTYIPEKPVAGWVSKTYYAKFTKDLSKWFSVVYNTDGNGTINGVKDSIPYENLLIGSNFPAQPEVAADPGYLFDGWYEGSTKVDAFPPAVTESKEYTARFKKDESKWFTVTYSTDGNGTIDGQKTAVVKRDLLDGSTFPSRPAVEADYGYQFDGWYEGSTKVNAFPTTVTESKEYTARFVKDESKWFTITFRTEEHGKINGGKTDIVHSEILDGSVFPGRPGTTADPGYLTDGWYDGNNKIIKFPETVTESKTYVLKCVKDPSQWFTVTYKTDGNGTIDGQKEPVEKTDLLRGSAFPAQPAVEADHGYQFDGWYEESTKVDTFPTAVTESKEYTARFEKDESKWFTVTYNTDGNGTIDGQKTAVVKTDLLDGSAFPSSPAVAADYGYQFDGWYEGSTKVDAFPTTVTESKDYVARFVERQDLPYEVHYFYDNVENKLEQVIAHNGKFNEKIPYDAPIVKTYNNNNYVLEYINGADNKVTVEPELNIVNIYYALDEIGTGPDPDKPDQIPDKYQITFTYTADTNGKVEGRLKEVVTREKATDGSFSTTNPAYPEALVTATADSGYSFQNWTSSEVGDAAGKPVSTFASEADIKKAGFTTDSVFTAHFYAKDDTTYRVEYYYESQGKYPASTDSFEIRTGKTDASVSVTDNDKAKNGYVYDTTASNVESGIVKGDNSLVLKLYFKQQFTVTYQPGDHAFFTEQVIGGISYGDKTPEFTGEMNITGRYVFDGWKPSVAGTVTESAVYVAQWRYTGGSDGGGGGNTPNPNKPFVPEGPAGGTVTVEPGDVPLANLPEGGPTDNLILIDDGNVPLAGLPKTGDRAGAHAGLAALLSGFLLAAFTVLSNRKKEEEK